MKPNGRNLNLTSYDEIFQTEEAKIEASQEKVIDIPLSQLHPFTNHPFKVTDDESMLETAESITKHGVLVPVIARPRKEGGYELISGHRRKRASEVAGKETLLASSALSTMTLPPLSWLTAISSVRIFCPVNAPSLIS